MSNVQRKRTGQSAPVKAKIQASNVVEIGDLVAISGAYVAPAVDFSDASTVSFHDSFLGVLIEGATTGNETSDTDCLVETVGEFEYPCVPLPGDQVVGTHMGPSDGGAQLSNQELAKTTSTESVGQLSQPGKSGDTTCIIRIKSVVMLDRA